MRQIVIIFDEHDDATHVQTITGGPEEAFTVGKEIATEELAHYYEEDLATPGCPDYAITPIPIMQIGQNWMINIVCKDGTTQAVGRISLRPDHGLPQTWNLSDKRLGEIINELDDDAGYLIKPATLRYYIEQEVRKAMGTE